jgi:hypothetical protein
MESKANRWERHRGAWIIDKWSIALMLVSRVPRLAAVLQGHFAASVAQEVVGKNPR